MRDPLYDCLKKASREARQKRIDDRLEYANSNDNGGWIKHTAWHWSRAHKGKRLDYYPTKKKFSYGGKMFFKDVFKFMEE